MGPQGAVPARARGRGTPACLEPSHPARLSSAPPPAPSPHRPAAFLQPSQLLVSLPCQALCHGSWLVPPPSLRSPAYRTLLLRLEPALTLARTRLTPARQPSTWTLPAPAHSWWLCPCPWQSPQPCRHSVLVGLRIPHSRAPPPMSIRTREAAQRSHPLLKVEPSLDRPPCPPPGPASVPTAWDPCRAPSHLGASGPSGPPGSQGNGSHSRRFYWEV